MSKPDSVEELERRFFGDSGGAPVPDDHVDPELSGDHGSALVGQILLVLLVAAFAAWLAASYLPELRYLLSTADAEELGPAEDLTADPRRAPGGRLALPSNRYVAIEGVTERRSESEDRRYAKMIGAHIYVLTREVDDRPRVLRHMQPQMEDRIEENDIRRADRVAGRLIAFDDLPRRYQGVVMFYSKAYGVEFCGYEPVRELKQFLHHRRETARLELFDRLGREPTQQELRERLGRDAECQPGYLLLAGESPRDYWYFALFYVIFGSVLAGSTYHIVRVARQRSSETPPKRRTG